MSLSLGDRTNFETLQEAFQNGDVALMECQLAATGEPVAVVVRPTTKRTGASSSPPLPCCFPETPTNFSTRRSPRAGSTTEIETMGLTIHYALHSDTRSSKEARRLVEDLRKRALDLPFAEVGEVVELKGDACQFDRYGQDHPHRWLLVQAGQYFEREHIHYSVMPKHVIAFSCDVGDGCEEANFGLCLYPGVWTSPTRGRGVPASCGRS